MHKLSNGVTLPDVGVGTFELTKKLTPQSAEDFTDCFFGASIE